MALPSFHPFLIHPFLVLTITVALPSFPQTPAYLAGVAPSALLQATVCTSSLALPGSPYRYLLNLFWGFPGGTSGKEPACQCRRCKRHGFDPWVGKIPWRRARQPTPVLLPPEEPGGLQSISVKKSWTRLKGLCMYAYRPTLGQEYNLLVR